MMFWMQPHADEYELSRETSLDSQSTPDPNDDSDQDSHLLSGQPKSQARWSATHLLFRYLVPVRLVSQYTLGRARSGHRRRKRGWTCLRRSAFRNFVLLSYTFFAIVVVLTFLSCTLFPSYTHLPPHYRELQHRVQSSDATGRGNPRQEKVFIAASLYDKGGHLLGGHWAQNILRLIDLLGSENVYLSVYENDAGAPAKEAFEAFKKRLPCNHTITFDEHLSFHLLPHVALPDGTERVTRIAYLSEVRNRALQPLGTVDTHFDKLLYLNDVAFDPTDAVQLLFSTNTDDSGLTRYRAACAVDFINPFKFYDTFATRDLEGYSLGVPFFPWFSANGGSHSRQEVIRGKDAVRVRSCWGGMVAFDARFFQQGRIVPDDTAGALSPRNLTAPYRFRAEDDLFWDASECCLINADIQSTDPVNPGIFMNPFIRVAYDMRTLSWLGFTRRFERLYSPIHYLIDILVNLPRYNPRRHEQAWQQVEESVWVPDRILPKNGSFEVLSRIATHSGFCGRRKLPIIKETLGDGERNWEFYPIPS